MEQYFKHIRDCNELIADLQEQRDTNITMGKKQCGLTEAEFEDAYREWESKNKWQV